MSKLTKFEWLALVSAVGAWEADHIDGDPFYDENDRRKALRRQAAMNRALEKVRP